MRKFVGFVLGLIAGYLLGRLWPLKQREGSDDIRPASPGDPTEYVNCLVRSCEEFDEGNLHPPTWYVVKKGDGRLARHLVIPSGSMQCLLERCSVVFQLPEMFLDENFPVEPGISACCNVRSNLQSNLTTG